MNNLQVRNIGTSLLGYFYYLARDSHFLSLRQAFVKAADRSNFFKLEALRKAATIAYPPYRIEDALTEAVVRKLPTAVRNLLAAGAKVQQGHGGPLYWAKRVDERARELQGQPNNEAIEVLQTLENWLAKQPAPQPAP